MRPQPLVEVQPEPTSGTVRHSTLHLARVIAGQQHQGGVLDPHLARLAPRQAPRVTVGGLGPFPPGGVRPAPAPPGRRRSPPPRPPTASATPRVRRLAASRVSPGR